MPNASLQFKQFKIVVVSLAQSNNELNWLNLLETCHGSHCCGFTQAFLKENRGNWNSLTEELNHG